jgi:hypothetical protein
VTQPKDREANHDTAQADNSSDEFGSLLPSEEFQYGVACSSEDVSTMALGRL